MERRFTSNEDNCSGELERDSASGFALLLERARGGCAESLGELVRSCREYLLLLANEQLESGIRGRVAPSDAVQETLALACQRLDQFRGDSREEWIGWLRAILQNELLGAARHHRAQRRDARRELLSKENHDPPDVDGNHTPRAKAMQAEEARLLRRAITRLSSDHRQVILLRNWEQLTFAEVGERMNRSEDAARKLWSRAVEQLEKELRHGT